MSLLRFLATTNTDSTLKWKWANEFNQCIYSESWRAGSGTGTDACELNIGWLPTGWYDMQGHYNSYSGTSIFGRAWHLQDKACSDPTIIRTQLLIHTEETSTNTQECDDIINNDTLKCWDGKWDGNANWDYRSEGCIKVRRDSPEHAQPGGMSAAHDRWHQDGGPSGHGPSSGSAWADRLYVHN